MRTADIALRYDGSRSRGPRQPILLALVGAAGSHRIRVATPGLVTSGLFNSPHPPLIGSFNCCDPAFDGSHIVEGALPRRWAVAYEKLRPYGMVLFFALIAIAWAFPSFDVIQRLIGSPVEWALSRYLAFAALFAGG